MISLLTDYLQRFIQCRLLVVETQGNNWPPLYSIDTHHSAALDRCVTVNEHRRRAIIIISGPHSPPPSNTDPRLDHEDVDEAIDVNAPGQRGEARESVGSRHGRQGGQTVRLGQR